jgi:hypothetical protein
MPTSQRDKMRELVKVYGNNESAIIKEYAAAEERGEVERERDVNNTPPEEYAKRLLYDGRKKKWF